jgi:hypothetical protein
MASTSPPSLSQLWQSAHAWLADMLGVFAAPGALAELTREACAALGRELRALECFVLKLLLVEAARFPHSPAPPRRMAASANIGPALASEPARRGARLSLRLPPAPKCCPRTHVAHAGALPPANARSLEQRFDALRRVLEDPIAAAARLARRLRAFGAEAYAVARRIARARPRHHTREPMLFAHACVYANDSARVFKESG